MIVFLPFLVAVGCGDGVVGGGGNIRLILKGSDSQVLR